DAAAAAPAPTGGRRVAPSRCGRARRRDHPAAAPCAAGGTTARARAIGSWPPAAGPSGRRGGRIIRRAPSSTAPSGAARSGAVRDREQGRQVRELRRRCLGAILPAGARLMSSQARRYYERGKQALDAGDLETAQQELASAVQLAPRFGNALV